MRTFHGCGRNTITELINVQDKQSVDDWMDQMDSMNGFKDGSMDKCCQKTFEVEYISKKVVKKQWKRHGRVLEEFS